jgi:chloramphenicol 3-O phosphotransferase
VAALASVGNDVIMDYPLSERWRLDDLLVVLEGYDVTLVEVGCAADELERRGQARGDRPTGLARSQTGMDGYDEHDIAVDTTNASPEVCARQIADLFATLSSPKAFERLRAKDN